jgi:hypothetical protein
MSRFLKFINSFLVTIFTPYKSITALFLSMFTSWLIKDSLTPTLFWGKNYYGRNVLIQLGILTVYILLFFILFLLLAVIFCFLFPKRALLLRNKLTMWLNLVNLYIRKKTLKRIILEQYKSFILFVIILILLIYPFNSHGFIDQYLDHLR